MRIPYDSLCLRAVCDEAQVLVGLTVQRVLAPRHDALLLEFFRDGVLRLLISCHPEFTRMHFTKERLRDTEPPPGFLQTAKHHLKDASVTAVRQIGFDRIAELQLTKEGRRYVLRIELVGSHGNVRLLGGSVEATGGPGGKQLGALKPSKHTPKDDIRPPVLLAKEGDDLKEFSGVSPFLTRLIAAQGLAFLRDAWNPVHVPGHGAYPVSVVALGFDEVPFASYSEAAEAHYASSQWEADTEHERLSLLGNLKKALASRERRLGELKKAIQASDNADHEQMLGELILAFGSQSPGPVVEAIDYEGQPISIPVNEDMSHVENAQLHFRRAKKARSGREDVERQLEHLEADMQTLQRAVLQIESTHDPEVVRGSREWAVAKGLLKIQTLAQKPEDRPFEGKRVREVTGPGGVHILYGENSDANDYLTTKIAKPDDIWLHVRGAVSAHVVIRTNRKPERIGPEALRFAAQLAVRNSPSKHSGLVAVDYTLKKYVRKPKGSKPGSVLYTHEKTLDVTP